MWEDCRTDELKIETYCALFDDADPEVARVGGGGLGSSRLPTSSGKPRPEWRAGERLKIESEHNSRLRALCSSKPGETESALGGQRGGQIADLRAVVQAAGLRIRHAAQASDDNLHASAIGDVFWLSVNGTGGWVDERRSSG